ncbi:TerB family tellurite resistance protein [Paenibacillus chartarius]|uniref:TerB family tellurite resistance protein n=1 Tax=Paenibacillus chartarius TaxID=747481 RepID=A0ABV6DPN1_9BACL
MFLHLLDNDEHKAAFLELANLVTKVDGYVNKKEKMYLKAFRAEMNLPEPEHEQYADRSVADIIGGIDNELVRHIMFTEILIMTFSDGDYNDSEKQIVTEIREHLGISADKYDAFLNWVKRHGELQIQGMQLIMGI